MVSPNSLVGLGGTVLIFLFHQKARFVIRDRPSNAVRLQGSGSLLALMPWCPLVPIYMYLAFHETLRKYIEWSGAPAIPRLIQHFFIKHNLIQHLVLNIQYFFVKHFFVKQFTSHM